MLRYLAAILVTWGLRDYGVDGQLGLEPTPEEYVTRMVEIFRGVRRVLRDDGTLWVNLGDSYANDGKWGGSSSGLLQPALHGQTGVGRGKRHTGLKPKDLVGIPWMVAFALRADGWYLRSDIIWAKPNPMPESVQDRPTKAHEYLFLLAKSGAPLLWRHRDTREWASAQPVPDYVWRHRETREETREPQAGRRWMRLNLWGGLDYYFDQDAVREPMAPESAARYGYRFGGEKSEALTEAEASGPGTRTHPIGERAAGAGRNIRSVWTVATQPYPGAHFATFPPKLIEPCIKAGCPEGGVVLDPFGGAGTTGLVADRLGRDAVLIELNPEYAEMARQRIRGDAPLFADVT